MELTVTLKPHIGQKQTALGGIAVTHNQWMVYAASTEQPNQQFIGYLPHEPGRPFLPVGPWTTFPQELKDALMAKIGEAAGDVRPLGIEPLDPTSPEAMAFFGLEPDTEQEDEEEEAE